MSTTFVESVLSFLAGWEPMTRAIDRIRDVLHEQTKDMKPEEYKELLEELAADIDGNLEALLDENPGLE
jgi:hypothetical protein